MRVAIYARVSTTNHGQDRNYRRASYANSAKPAAGKSRASTSMRESAEQKTPGQS